MPSLSSDGTRAADGPKRKPARTSAGCDSKRIDWVTLYKPKLSAGGGGGGGGGGGATNSKRRIKLYHVLFAAVYIYQAVWITSTIGEPYRKFLEKADREGFQVMEGAAKMRAELEFALSDINDPNRPKEKMGWFDWMNMDVEEHAERRKRERERTVLDSLPKSMRVPGRHAPAFVPCLVTGIVVVVHLLILLLQVWSVGFNVWINYREVSAADVVVPDEIMDVDGYLDEGDGGVGTAAGAVGDGGVNNSDDDDGVVGGKSIGRRIMEKAESAPISSRLPTHARVTPAKGRDVLVPLLYLPTLGITFEYHRRRYAYNEESGVWAKVRCRTDMPTSFFQSWKGFSSTEQVAASHIRFGRNVFDVRQPTFGELYKAQLLSPFTVFQLFCVVLWMLDDYWQYSAFTLFMILMFEGTVVFARIKSLSALRGMGNKTRPVFVYRMGRWKPVESFDLLPGDVVSMTRHKPHYAKSDGADKSGGSGAAAASVAANRQGKLEDEGGDVVPADVLLLRGSCVVNEASLTGESVPQMKEGLSEIVEGELLSMKNAHKGHVLYAGTKLLQCKGVDIVQAEEDSSDEDEDADEAGGDATNKKKEKKGDAGEKAYGDIPKPPDGGCLCFVLRTGFSSAQGKLVRMIEGSQEKVKGHEKETALLLLLLFIFAVASASYVLYHGIHDENRSQYELLLHCILIITSVIPPELPMQMALAVNNSLMTLMKMQVFCTEPYRVPIAGKLDCCLFDKTGTLTTDELVAVGVYTAKTLADCSRSSGADPADAEQNDLTPMSKCNGESALVLAGCHSLVTIEGETTGDPLESAALRAMRWGVVETSGRVEPLPATEKKHEGKAISVAGASTSSLEILSRHHFSSKLQRMSCVVRDVSNRRSFAAVKGSPEAVGNLLAQKPKGYDGAAKALSKSGFRVISLAYKILRTSSDVDAAKEARAQCEMDLVFAGFIAFTCRVRKDTKLVLRKLRQGGMSVAMVTGDALLTAAHVAKEVAICDFDEDDDDDDPIASEQNEELRAFLKSKRIKGVQNTEQKKRTRKQPLKTILILEQDKLGMLYWQCYEREAKVQDYSAAEVPELAQKYDLATTGKNLAAACEYDEVTKTVLAHFKIFARMTPDAKETVIECLHSVGALCLMCGDGANDVGALKQADVGVALLSGFGDVNVDKGEDSHKKEKGTAATGRTTAFMTPEQLGILRKMPVSLLKAQIRALGTDPDKYPGLVEKEDLIQLYQIKAREAAVKKHDKKNAMEKANMSKAELQAKHKADLAAKQRKMELRARELEEQGEQWATLKAMKEFWAAELEEGKKKKAALAKSRSIEGSAASIVAQLEDLEMDELPMVKLGDASIAAPFTSKVPSIRSCVDIVRQGRCTLVTSIQMYQILALNCLISSYSLSVLYLDGIKYGDKQMTAMGMLMSVSFMSVSRSKPLEKLSSVKPLTSIFHPSLFISLLGQFSIHLVTMMLAVSKAKEHMPTEYKVDLDGEFKPGIFNSVVFLVSNVQQVTVFVVNLQGRPFMNGLTENRPLLWSLLVTFILTFMFASETVPGLNKYFELVPFPDDAFRNFILRILVADVMSCFLLDRLMKFIFCRKILFASVEGTTSADVMKLGRTIGVILGLMYMFLGNDEQWEEMLRDEGYYNSSDTEENGTSAGLAEDVVSACVGDNCGNETGGVLGDIQGSEL